MTEPCGPSVRRFDGIREAGLALGTVVSILLPHADETTGRALLKGAFEEIRRIEGLLSAFVEESDVWRLNKTGRCAGASNETLELFRRATLHSELSGGAFDITAGSPGEQSSRTEHVRESAERPSYRGIRVEADTIWFDRAGIKVGLGAIGKGYAVDKAIAFLAGRGVEHAVVNAGGDLRVIGGSPPKRPWRVGIRNPRSRRNMAAAISLRNGAVATSGAYQRPLRDIFDPRTGQDCDGVLSASVVTDTAADADALATSIYVLGPERGRELVDRWPGCAAMWIMAEGTAIETERWKEQRRLEMMPMGRDRF